VNEVNARVELHARQLRERGGGRDEGGKSGDSGQGGFQLAAPSIEKKGRD
jgi:hypothetical protein